MVDRFRWAERRDGLVTSEIARASGMSRRQIDREHASGRLRRIRKGVSVVNGAPRTWRQAVRAVLLASGTGVAVAHRTALAWLGGEREPADQDKIHVITTLDRQVDQPGVICHRSGTIEAGDIVMRDGIACTSPLRTVLDISGELTTVELGKTVDDFIRRRMLRIEDLRERVDRTRPAPGRSPRTLRRVLAVRLPGYDPGESPLEARIAQVIDASSLPRPVQQHRVRIGSRRYRLDFAWPDRRLYLEGNGFGWHALASDLDNDATRQNELVAHGWTPIEITWRMSDDVIATTIRRFLALPMPRL